MKYLLTILAQHATFLQTILLLWIENFFSYCLHKATSCFRCIVWPYSLHQNVLLSLQNFVLSFLVSRTCCSANEISWKNSLAAREFLYRYLTINLFLIHFFALIAWNWLKAAIKPNLAAIWFSRCLDFFPQLYDWHSLSAFRLEPSLRIFHETFTSHLIALMNDFRNLNSWLPAFLSRYWLKPDLKLKHVLGCEERSLSIKVEIVFLIAIREKPKMHFFCEQLSKCNDWIENDRASL